MTDREFEQAVELLRRMIATLEIGVDVVADGRDDGVDARHGAESALADLTKRVRSALDSIGFDVDEWLEDEQRAEAERIRMPKGLSDPTGQNRTGAARWHAAKAAERELIEAEVEPEEDGRELRARIWRDYETERKRIETLTPPGWTREDEEDER